MNLLPDDMKSGVPVPPQGGTAGSSSVPKPPMPPTPPRPGSAPIAQAPITARPATAPLVRPPVAPAAPAAAAKASEAPAFGMGGLRVSLLPSESENKARPDLRQRVITLVLVLVVETLVIGGAYMLLLNRAGARADEGTQLAARISALTTDVHKKEQDVKDAVAWNAQRVAASALLDQHVRWTALFDLLEMKTLPTVSYAGFAGDAEKGTVSLDAVAKTYRDVAEQVVVLRATPGIRDVRTTSAAAKVDEKGMVTGVTFSMVLQLDPTVLVKK